MICKTKKFRIIGIVALAAIITLAGCGDPGSPFGGGGSSPGGPGGVGPGAGPGDTGAGGGGGGGATGGGGTGTSPATHAVTWHANGGAPAPTQATVTHNGSIPAPVAMTQAGHVFAGWYDNAAFTGAAVTFPIAGVTADREFWARWTPGVDITGMTTAQQIQDAIAAALAVGDATVIGSAGMAGMTLDVPAGRTLNWQVNYSGSGTIAVTGGGDFVVAGGGRIENTEAGPAVNLDSFGGRFIVGTDGEIARPTGSGHGIRAGGTSAATIIVRGGSIVSTGPAIDVSGANNVTVFIESGTVQRTAGTGEAISINAGRLSISGGTITSPSISTIAVAGSALVYVWGAPVIANNGIFRFSVLTNGAYFTGAAIWDMFVEGGASGFTLGTDQHAGSPPCWPWPTGD